MQDRIELRSRSDPVTRDTGDATLGSSEDGFEVIRPVNNFSSGRPGSRLLCHLIPVARNRGLFGRLDVL